MKRLEMSLKSIMAVCVLLGVIQFTLADFTDTPGTMKSDPGGMVTLTWNLTTVFNPEMFGARVDITSGDGTYIVGYYYAGSPTTCNTYSDTRITCIIPATPGPNVGFSITGITDADADQYTCKVVHQLDGTPVTDRDAYIYVYKPPNVQLTGTTQVTEGDPIALTCAATSQSIPDYLRPGALMVYTWTITNAPVNHVINGNTTTISATTKDNNGATFRCQAKEDGSTMTPVSSSTKTLDIQYSPGTPVVPDVPTAPLVEGLDSLSVTCQLSGQDIGNPSTHVYHWNNIDSSFSQDTTSDKLTVSPINAQQHHGRWQCQPQNSIGLGQIVSFVTTVEAKPTITQDLPLSHGDLNTNPLSISCIFKAKPIAPITWTYIDDGTVMNLPEAVTTTDTDTTVDRVYTQTTSTLSWHPAVAPDNDKRRRAGGTYKCQAGNNNGIKNSQEMMLTIYYAPFGMSLNSTELTVTEGDDVSVLCSSDCSPACNFTWTRLSDTSWSQKQPLLSLSDISRHYHDQYTCRAVNAYGQLPTGLHITVNYGSEITSFHPSASGDILEGSTLDITCDVSSRPNSNITMTNTNTTDTIRYVNDVLTAVYTFTSIHVLDSAVYQCSAVNGITPVDQGTQQLTLNVNGGFSFCETPPSSEGSPLGANITIHICLSANPFTSVSSSNWQFELQNSTLMTQTLPDGTSTTTDDTSHMYKKYLLLMIPAVLVGHYGTYTLTVKNEHNTYDLVHEFILVPEDKPEHPTDLTVTDTTAVSIYLQWMAGFDGGPDQTFWLYVADMISGTGFMVTDIPDTTGTDGGLMAYTLTSDKHGLVPDRSYAISVGAINNIGNVTSPQTTTAQTKAEPSFEGEEPQIVYTENTAQITWSVNNLRSVSYILVDVCISDSVTCGPTENITAPEIQPYIVTLPEGEAQGYTFSFIFYDGVDKVQTHELEYVITVTEDAPPTAVIVGAVLGVLLAAGVIVAFVILWRRGIIPIQTLSRHDKKKPDKDEVQPEYLTTVELSASGSGYEELDQITQQSPRKQQHIPVIYQDLTVPSLNEMMRYEFTLDTLLSNGDYYSVWNGKLNVKDSTPLHVIVKTTKNPSAVHMRYLRGQGVALSNLRSCDYTIGCSGITKDNNFLIMDNTPLGNLREYLQAISGAAYGNVGSVQTNCTEMDFIHQAISGVVAVQELQPPALFYCLSSSHVLVTSHRQCKISGFASSEIVKAREEWEETNKSSLPIKWLAPEAIELKHTAQSDVWSLAILMWEILNNGKSPLEDTNDDNARQQILGGFRPFKTPSCFNEIYNIMCRCWLYEPADRPSASDLQLQCLELNQYEPV